ncbi:MgtC/SapB family protein [Streptomyces sp. NPDC052051]|uniref:MgtC/SapB family protein n=1 Tax=Streptomyces sp. NPDC052051 TaxID=3154649 RepID=UPI00342DEBC6
MHWSASQLWNPSSGQGLRQLAELGLALLLSTLIGLERAFQQKSAGLRTHALVGVGAALFMEVSQHGFANVLGLPNVVLDPSRVAAQIVTGIGFIGGGLIFVRRDIVRGLTTAATIWLTAAVGMACGGGLWLLALAVATAHFLIVRGYPLITRRFPAISTPEQTDLQLSYLPGYGALPRILERCTAVGFRVLNVRIDRAPWQEGTEETGLGTGATEVHLFIEGTGNVHHLLAELAELDGVLRLGGPEGEGPY